MRMSSRSWVWSRCSRICRGCCACVAGCCDEFMAWRPDVFIGIDAPEFNLGLARRSCTEAGLTTVQYVSPQVWAWRAGRVRSHRRALRPGAVPAALRAGVLRAPRGARRNSSVIRWPTRFRSMPIAPPRVGALGIGDRRPCVALLPGSRSGEVHAARRRISSRRRRRWPRLRPASLFIAPMAVVRSAQPVRAAAARPCGLQPACELLDGQARLALQAADAALVASGTASLEALLCRCPMVVAYRFSGDDGVPAARAAHGAAARISRCPICWPASRWCRNSSRRLSRARNWRPRCSSSCDDVERRGACSRRASAAIHVRYAQDGAARAADAVLELIARFRGRMGHRHDPRLVSRAWTRPDAARWPDRWWPRPCMLDPTAADRGLRDSKQLTPQRRERARAR